MGDEHKRAALIDATLDEAMEGLDDLLPPHVMAAIRSRVEDDLVAHPAMRRLVGDALPRAVPSKSDEVPTGPEVLEKVRQVAEKLQRKTSGKKRG